MQKSIFSGCWLRQFAWKLRTDERVVCMERTNIRYVTPEDIGEKLDFASIDVSLSL